MKQRRLRTTKVNDTYILIHVFMLMEFSGLNGDLNILVGDHSDKSKISLLGY